MNRLHEVDDRRLLEEQIAYYRARAPEYDEWFLRQGRYDHGPEHRAAWLREIAAVEAALESMQPPGDVVELACGTGWWTKRLAAGGRRVVAVDASPEALALNRERVRSPDVEYRELDLLSWRPTESFDLVFFSFWLSHVPPERFDGFWQTVRALVRPGGRAFFMDSLNEPTSTARDHDPPGASGIVRRRLNDGRQFDIVKVFYDPADLEGRLLDRGWRGWVRSTGTFFLYGSVRPADARSDGSPAHSVVGNGRVY